MWEQVVFAFVTLFSSATHQSWVELALKFFPFVVLLEAPFFLLVCSGMVKYGLREHRPYLQRERYPRVSCVITCYSEGDDVRKTIQSLAQQIYPGFIEIIAVVDGAVQNEPTLRAARGARELLAGARRRALVVLPKWQRGGRVSSLNAGLSIASGEIVMALDGDTSFDNDMVRNATRHFDDPGVVGVAGSLRVRNARRSLAARMQALEYMLSIGAGKTGLSEFNIVNNISGAFGVFRTSFIRNLGGWDAGTAEDLDMTMRIKQYFGRHPGLRIVFDPHAVGHTDAPDTWRVFFRQRLRWDGDMFYIFIRKFRLNLRPRLLGWRNFLFVVVNGLVMQVLMPFLIVAYTGVMLFTLPVGAVLGVLGFVYVVYLAALLFYFLLYLVAVSERPRHDAGYLRFLPLFPLFAFVNRVHCTFSILQEVFLKTHLDSAMAPWWVLRKTKF
ncbi:glycosyltransferase family 2 protein [Acidovorax sp. NCPPB 3576]|uniref:glycosyltransferase family 2 protein n=1 Tax=Acidovorax sp. NCPPB 3576 TaxID=2940488 RepID=UPI00234B9D2A|nr:glycosyltransferase [Acidovorax sp. NCPPB 3576]WCM87804.1 glycosyltransferase family 2 protein [Acidovorax sp. NCPPB 3576]